MKNKLSEELKHCLDGKGCFECAYSDEKAIMSCRNLLQNAYEKIKYFEDLEEQGLLLKLPCKVGDTVYEVQKIRHRIQPLEIISVYIGRMGELYFYWELKDGIGIYQNVKGFGISQLGKTVFLTQAEAEEALKRVEREDKTDEK